MNRRDFARDLALGCAAVLAASGAAVPARAASKFPTTWDGLTRVKSKTFKLVYLKDGADFRGYAKVLLDPTEIAFEKHWKNDYNSEQLGLGEQLTDKDLRDMADEGQKGAGDILRKAYAAGGYPVADAPGPDVLRVRTALVDIRVSAPDRELAARERVYSRDAGEAKVVFEARDSVTGALLGRAIDGKTAGDNLVYERNRVTNRADFARLVEAWAKDSVKGLDELKTLSPIKAADVLPG